MPDPTGTKSLSKRPYLLRALHQWITDSGHTPHIVVAADQPGVQVPTEFVENGRIILNISYTATSHLELGNDEVVFNARFGGRPRQVRVPLRAVLGIYARESGEGLVFSADDYDDPPGPDSPGPGPGPDTGPPTPPPPGRPTLKVVK